MRAPTACLACRSRRRKCDIPAAEQPCIYCTARHIQCVGGSYTASSNSKKDTNDPKSPSLISSDVDNGSRGAKTSSDIAQVKMPSADVCLELLELYFDFIHDQFHSIFHRPSLREDVRMGKAPPVILYAIMALSARFSTNAVFAGIDSKERGKPYANESRQLLDLEEVSLTTIQACVLLGSISVAEGNPTTESLYYTIACRIALLLDLAHRPSSNKLEAEVHRRVWWTLYMIDTWSSTGVRLQRLMPRWDDIPLPIDEAVFLSARRDSLSFPSMDVAAYTSESSLLSQMIKLNFILMEVNDFNKRSVAAPTLISEDDIEALCRKLDDWYSALPYYMRDTPENLASYASQGLGRIFVAIYLGFYHFGQLLFYQFLHKTGHGSFPRAHAYAKYCKTHAARLCEITYAGYSTPGCEVRYTMVGHVLVIASTVQIHTLLFSDSEEQIRTARLRLERNFEILTKLKEYWPTLEASFSRLRAFHKACQSSMDTSFRLDQWMLTFLSEYSVKMEDRTEIMTPWVWTVDNLGVSPPTALEKAENGL